MAGNPIIAIKTGGLTRQVVDHRDKSENGIALDVDCKVLVGSQQVPYIYEDYVSVENVSKAMMTLYNKTPDEKHALSKKVREYAITQFSHQKTIDMWHNSMNNCISTWKERYNRYECITI